MVVANSIQMEYGALPTQGTASCPKTELAGQSCDPVGLETATWQSESETLKGADNNAVSYTHLTLPTIRLV